MVCLYDILIIGTNIELIKSIKRNLTNNIDMKELDGVDVTLMMIIIKISNGIELSQSH